MYPYRNDPADTKSESEIQAELDTITLKEDKEYDVNEAPTNEPSPESVFNVNESCDINVMFAHPDKIPPYNPDLRFHLKENAKGGEIIPCLSSRPAGHQTFNVQVHLRDLYEDGTSKVEPITVDGITLVPTGKVHVFYGVACIHCGLIIPATYSHTKYSTATRSNNNNTNNEEAS